MIRANIKSIISSDVDLSSFQPEDKNFFGFWVEMEIGPHNEEGADIFQIFLCSFDWVNAQNKPGWWPHACVVFHEYDSEKVFEFLKTHISAIEGDDWKDVSKKLRLLARWEFEQYDP